MPSILGLILLVFIKIYGGLQSGFSSLILNNNFIAPLFFIFPSADSFSKRVQSVFLNPILFFGAVSFFSSLIVISVYDIYHKIIPDAFSYFIAAISFVYAFVASALFFGRGFFIQAILSGAALVFVFFAMAFLSREKWMGYGDVKLVFSLGLFLGPAGAFFAFLFSFWIGAIFGIIVLFLSKKFSLKSQIPFAPFLALGAFLSFLLNFNFY